MGNGWNSSVRCIYSGSGDFTKDVIYVIVNGYIVNNYRTVIRYNGILNSIEDVNQHFCSQFELVKENEKMFSKDDLKVGYVVQRRDGTLFMVVPVMSKGGANNEYEMRIVDKEYHWDSIPKYSDDLKTDNNFTGFDIVKVYGFSKYANNCLQISTENRNLIWERKEEIKKEMTVEEIEKELGYSVKIVK